MAERKRQSPEEENLKALEALSAANDPFPPVPGKPKPPAPPPAAQPPAPKPAQAKPSAASPAASPPPKPAPALPPLKPPPPKPTAAKPAPRLREPAQLPVKPAPSKSIEPIPITPSVPAVPPPAPAMPAPRTHPALASSSDDDSPPDGPPRFRCLRCGYPIADLRNPRCNECGRVHTKDTLEWWFSDEERTRLNNVIWLVLAVIFTKLMFIPLIMGLARCGGAVAVGVACTVAMNGKKGTVGGYCGVSGLIIAVIMGLGFSWDAAYAVPFYTLEMVAACLLLLSVLHDPMGGGVGGALPARQIAPILLFVVPLLGAGCWWLQKAVGPDLGIFSGWEPFTPFGFILPYVAAAAVWVFVWLALAGTRKMLFASLEGAAAE